MINTMSQSTNENNLNQHYEDKLSQRDDDVDDAEWVLGLSEENVQNVLYDQKSQSNCNLNQNNNNNNNNVNSSSYSGESESDRESDRESVCSDDIVSLSGDESGAGDSDSVCLLRFGTLNIGQGFNRKIYSILSRAQKRKLNILALQEVGDPIDMSFKRILQEYGYDMYVCGNSKAGVALLVSHSTSPFIRRVVTSGTDGRMVGVILETNKQSILVVSVYMPTGLDFISDTYFNNADEFEQVENDSKNKNNNNNNK